MAGTNAARKLSPEEEPRLRIVESEDDVRAGAAR